MCVYHYGVCLWICIYLHHSVYNPDGRLGLQEFPSASMQNQRLISHRMSDLTMRSAVTLRDHCIMRK